MAEVVNLNKFRKERERAAEKSGASVNRVKFGLDKANKAALRQDAERQAAEHRGRRIEDYDDEPPKAG
jgi:hypothetical protein